MACDGECPIQGKALDVFSCLILDMQVVNCMWYHAGARCRSCALRPSSFVQIDRLWGTGGAVPPVNGLPGCQSIFRACLRGQAILPGPNKFARRLHQWWYVAQGTWEYGGSATRRSTEKEVIARREQRLPLRGIPRKNGAEFPEVVLSCSIGARGQRRISGQSPAPPSGSPPRRRRRT